MPGYTRKTKEGFFAMNDANRMLGALPRLLPTLLALIVAGCATLDEAPEAIPVPESTEVEPAPAPKTHPPPPAVVEPKLFQPRVAVVLSARLPAFENVANEFDALLADYSVYDLADSSMTPRELFADIEKADTQIVFAIGLRAATVAKAYAKVPVVFCQVFNVVDNDLISARVKGVAALPPLALQIGAWKEVNPGLEKIGAILGTGHDSLVLEATRAAETAGLILHHRVAKSDRETLYLFNRLAPNIDGFWLFPDNRILSPTVLRQMLDYASRHDVQVAVFNPNLLELGATLSATSVESDVAATVVAVARRVIQGRGDSVPDVTPLKRINVKTNRTVAKRLELAAAGTDGEDAL